MDNDYINIDDVSEDITEDNVPWVEYVSGAQFSDYSLRSYLQRYISSHHDKESNLKGFMRCGMGLLPTGRLPAVFVCKDMLSEEGNARFSGLLDCHSPWACPYCSPREMAKKGADIACALDALAAQDLWAFMVTFTLPHHAYMSAEDSFTILKSTWRNFTKNSTAHRQNFIKKYTCADGFVSEYHLKGNAFAQCKKELGIIHYVKVYEFTYGENGWHPHIHVLFWCHKSKWNLITKYQKPLLDLWWSSAKRAALAYWNKKFPDKKDENAKLVEDYYSEARKNPANDVHRAVYISVDSKGRPVRQLSSSYISGFSGSIEKDKKKWAANQELTHQCAKSAQSGHYMPFDLLTAALNAHKAKDFETEKKFAGLFLEYAKYTRKKRRVDWSLSGIKKIIAEWKKTNTWVEVLKKKFKERPESWKIVCWFTPEQWSQICWLELTTEEFIKTNILIRCRAPDVNMAFDEIYKYLLPFGIDIMENGKHPDQEIFENQIYENLMASEISA